MERDIYAERLNGVKREKWCEKEKNNDSLKREREIVLCMYVYISISHNALISIYLSMNVFIYDIIKTTPQKKQDFAINRVDIPTNQPTNHLSIYLSIFALLVGAVEYANWSSGYGTITWWWGSIFGALVNVEYYCQVYSDQEWVSFLVK